MASDFLDEQRQKLIKLVQTKPAPQPEAVAAIALIDILDILLRMTKPFEPQD